MILSLSQLLLFCDEPLVFRTLVLLIMPSSLVSYSALLFLFAFLGAGTPTCEHTDKTDSDVSPCCTALLPSAMEFVTQHFSNRPVLCNAPSCRCVFAPFSPGNMVQLLQGKSVVFMGDSTIRELYLYLLWAVNCMDEFPVSDLASWMDFPNNPFNTTCNKKRIGEKINKMHIKVQVNHGMIKHPWLRWQRWETRGVRFHFYQDWWPEPFPSNPLGPPFMNASQHLNFVGENVYGRSGTQPVDLFVWNIGLHATHVWPESSGRYLSPEMEDYWTNRVLEQLNGTLQLLPRTTLPVWCSTVHVNETRLPQKYLKAWSKWVQTPQDMLAACHAQSERGTAYCREAQMTAEGTARLHAKEMSALRAVGDGLQHVDVYSLTKSKGHISRDGRHYPQTLMAVQLRLLQNILEVKLPR